MAREWHGFVPRRAAGSVLLRLGASHRVCLNTTNSRNGIATRSFLIERSINKNHADSGNRIAAIHCTLWTSDQGDAT
jgi:hypothetical protein